MRQPGKEAHWLQAPMNKRLFHGDDALGTVLVGGRRAEIKEWAKK